MSFSTNQARSLLRLNLRVFAKACFISAPNRGFLIWFTILSVKCCSVGTPLEHPIFFTDNDHAVQLHPKALGGKKQLYPEIFSRSENIREEYLNDRKSLRSEATSVGRMLRTCVMGRKDFAPEVGCTESLSVGQSDDIETNSRHRSVVDELYYNMSFC